MFCNINSFKLLTLPSAENTFWNPKDNAAFSVAFPTQKQTIFLFISFKFKFLTALELVKIKQVNSEKLIGS